SATESWRGEQRAVAVDVDLTQVLQQTAALADQQQQASPGVVVLLVVLEMLGEPLDALREQRDLNFRGAGVALVRGVFGNDSLLDISFSGQRFSFSDRCAEPRGWFSRACLRRGRHDGRDRLPSPRPDTAVICTAVPGGATPPAGQPALVVGSMVGAGTSSAWAVSSTS